MPSGRLARASNPTSLAAGASRAPPPIPAVGPRCDLIVRSARRGARAALAETHASVGSSPRSQASASRTALRRAASRSPTHLRALRGDRLRRPLRHRPGRGAQQRPFSIPGCSAPVSNSPPPRCSNSASCASARSYPSPRCSPPARSPSLSRSPPSAPPVVIPKLGRRGTPPPRFPLAAAPICGVTAVSALAPAISATQAEVSVAVANVVGNLGMLALPHLARRSGRSRSGRRAAQGRIHDTAQVFGAGLTYQQRYGDERAFQVAAVTKPTRNALLAAAVPAPVAKANATGRASAAGRGGDAPCKATRRRPRFSSRFAASAARSVGTSRRWLGERRGVETRVGQGDVVRGNGGARHRLWTAMAAVGLETSAAAALVTCPVPRGGAGAATVGVGFPRVRRRWRCRAREARAGAGARNSLARDGYECVARPSCSMTPPPHMRGHRDAFASALVRPPPASRRLPPRLVLLPTSAMA